MKRAPNPIIGKNLEAARVLSEKDTEYLVLTVDGKEYSYEVHADCCSHSWIEHLTIPDGLPSEIVSIDNNDNVERTEDQHDCDVLLAYETRVRTMAGDLVVEYRNRSNGYYGGSIEGLEQFVWDCDK